MHLVEGILGQCGGVGAPRCGQLLCLFFPGIRGAGCVLRLFLRVLAAGP